MGVTSSGGIDGSSRGRTPAAGEKLEMPAGRQELSAGTRTTLDFISDRRSFVTLPRSVGCGAAGRGVPPSASSSSASSGAREPDLESSGADAYTAAAAAEDGWKGVPRQSLGQDGGHGERGEAEGRTIEWRAPAGVMDDSLSIALSGIDTSPVLAAAAAAAADSPFDSATTTEDAASSESAGGGEGGVAGFQVFRGPADTLPLASNAIVKYRPDSMLKGDWVSGDSVGLGQVHVLWTSKQVRLNMRVGPALQLLLLYWTSLRYLRFFSSR